jgi:hypothetical protein
MIMAEESAEKLRYEFVCSAVWTEICKLHNSIFIRESGRWNQGCKHWYNHRISYYRVAQRARRLCIDIFKADEIGISV